MPATYNRVVLVGNLVRDPEARTTASGKAVVKFSLAVRNARLKDEILYIDCVAWDKLAETCAQLLRKGHSVLADGRLSMREYAAKDGSKKKTTEIILENMQLLGGPPHDDGEPEPPKAAQKFAFPRAGAARQAATPQREIDPFGDDDDLPF